MPGAMRHKASRAFGRARLLPPVPRQDEAVFFRGQRYLIKTVVAIIPAKSMSAHFMLPAYLGLSLYFSVDVKPLAPAER